MQVHQTAEHPAWLEDERMRNRRRERKTRKEHSLEKKILNGYQRILMQLPSTKKPVLYPRVIARTHPLGAKLNFRTVGCREYRQRADTAQNNTVQRSGNSQTLFCALSQSWHRLWSTRGSWYFNLASQESKGLTPTRQFSSSFHFCSLVSWHRARKKI